MNGKDLLTGMNYVRSEFIEEAEAAAFKEKTTRLPLRRTFLIAAVIAMMLLLVGCAVVYVLSMREIKVGEQQASYDMFDPDTLEYLGKHVYTEQVFTVAGLQDTPAYQAALEWFDFKQSYDPDYTIRRSVWGNEPEFPAEYSSYFIYTQDMKDKLDEITEKYGLKLAGAALDFRTLRNMCDALGIQRIHTAENDVTVTIGRGTCRENGNFSLALDFTLPEDANNEISATLGSLSWNRKDCFSDDVIAFEDTGDWKEWNYTTTSGNEVLIVRSPSSWKGYIICDREEAIMSLWIEARMDVVSDDGLEYLYLTDRQMEQIADAIDFGIQPRVATQEDVDNQPAASNEATQDGYTVKLKSVETDGWMARIVMGITAPEGTVISHNPLEGFEDERYSIGSTNFENFIPAVGETVSANGGWNVREDNDGLDNTQDLVLERHEEMADGSAPFGPGTVWKIHFEDLEGSYWDSEKHDYVIELLAEGEWNFEITFGEENGDFREIEFAKEPITMSAIVGWKPDGTDVFDDVKVTSFALHSMSAVIQYNFEGTVDFARYDMPMYAVMKDGTHVQFQSSGGTPGLTWYVMEKSIDVDQVDHIVLMDGTKLMVPGSAE